MEFYQYALNQFDDLVKWFNGITKADVDLDMTKHPDDTQQCTTADAQRIIGDLLTKNIIDREQFESINKTIGLDGRYVPSILHSNHTIRFTRYLVRQNLLPKGVLEKLKAVQIEETHPEDLDELRRFFDSG